MCCCCLECLACCACNMVCSICGHDVSTYVARFVYVINFAIVSVISWILGTYLKIDQLEKLPGFDQCVSLSGNEKGIRACYLELMIYKMMFGFFLWHLVQALLFIGVRDNEDVRVQIQRGWWPVKYLFLIGFVVAALYIPPSFYRVWFYFSIIGAGLFILYQILIMLDFATDWATSWVNKANDGVVGYGNDDDENCCSNKYLCGLFTVSIALYVGTLVLTILLYVFYTRPSEPGGCKKKNLNAALISVNLVLCVVSSLLSLHPAIREKNPNSGLLQSSIMAFYTTYLVFSASVSEPEEWTNGCDNIFASTTSTTSTSGQRAVIIIGLVITVLAVAYSSFMGTDSSSSKICCFCCDADNDIGSNPDAVPYNISLFHVILMLGGMYVQLLLTNWKTIDSVFVASSAQTFNADSKGIVEIAVDYGEGSVWVKMATSWVVHLFYLWSMLAPVIFPDRDFGYGTNDSAYSKV